MSSDQQKSGVRGMHTEDAPRDCGGCNVCCTAMRVAPFDKPAGTSCQHQSATGCDIYSSRPSVCRVWFCIWVRDTGRIFTEAHRPDKLGLFFTASIPDPITGEQTIYAHETVPDAAQLPEGMKIIRYLRQAGQVQVLPFRRPSPDQSGSTRLTRNGTELAA